MAKKIEIAKNDFEKMDDKVTSCATRLSKLIDKNYIDESVRDEAMNVYDAATGLAIMILQAFDKEAANRLNEAAKECRI